MYYIYIYYIYTYYIYILYIYTIYIYTIYIYTIYILYVYTYIYIYIRLEKDLAVLESGLCNDTSKTSAPVDVTRVQGIGSLDCDLCKESPP